MKVSGRSRVSHALGATADFHSLRVLLSLAVQLRGLRGSSALSTFRRSFVETLVDRRDGLFYETRSIRQRLILVSSLSISRIIANARKLRRASPERERQTRTSEIRALAASLSNVTARRTIGLACISLKMAKRNASLRFAWNPREFVLLLGLRAACAIDGRRVARAF